MGNSSSSTGKGHHDDTVDFGALTPQGVYTGPRDWNQQIVAQQIVERRLAPFYRPLEDYEDGWDDETILAHRKELPEPAEGAGDAAGHSSRESVHSGRHHRRGGSATTARESNRLNEASLYRGAAECPICFLYYPPNINRSRCCDQVICTECFVQIKRAEPDVTHLVSEPAACPYCVQPDFGVVYMPPKWRAGIGSEGAPPPSPSAVAAPPPAPSKSRRKSFGPNDPNVVTTDMIRPDWEQKLAAVKATAARRANRRIIMRQVGDRLIPVGISSGRVQVLPDGEAAGGGEPQGEGSGGSGSRRARRRERELNRLMGMIGGGASNYPGNVIGAQDLEELMIAEAMRLSLLEEEERQRKEREEQAKKGKARAEGDEGTSAVDAAGPSGSGSTDIPLPPVTGASLLPPPAASSTSLNTEERGRSGHRATSSVSSLGGTQSAPGAGGISRARSQPPFSTLAAGLRSAASAAVAVGAPGPASSEGEAPSRSSTQTPVQDANSSSSVSAVPTPPSVPSPPPAVPSLEVPDVRVTTAAAAPVDSPLEMTYPAAPEAIADLEEASAAPVAPTNDEAPTVTSSSPRPPPTHAASFASSLSVDSEAGGSTYDVLESDDESDSVAHEPLLRSETPVARQD